MKSHPLVAYFADTLNTETLLRKSTILDDMVDRETLPPSSPFARSTTGAIQVCMEWGKSLLLGTMEFLRRIC